MQLDFQKIVKNLRSLVTLDHGQDLVEYALIVALIACAATASLKVVASGIGNAYSTISTTFKADI